MSNERLLRTFRQLIDATHEVGRHLPDDDAGYLEALRLAAREAGGVLLEAETQAEVDAAFARVGRDRR